LIDEQRTVDDLLDLQAHHPKELLAIDVTCFDRSLAKPKTSSERSFGAFIDLFAAEHPVAIENFSQAFADDARLRANDVTLIEEDRSMIRAGIDDKLAAKSALTKKRNHIAKYAGAPHFTAHDARALILAVFAAHDDEVLRRLQNAVRSRARLQTQRRFAAERMNCAAAIDGDILVFGRHVRPG
jgi:hypothetical protein